MAVKTQMDAAQKLAATNSRNLRTLLLVQQFAAKEIGERIRQARRERGMTQEDLAAVASFSKRSLQNYENGVTIPYRHLRELSRLLKRPEEWFLYGEEPVEEEQFRRIVHEELEGVFDVLARLEQRLGERREPPQAEPGSGGAT